MHHLPPHHDVAAIQARNLERWRTLFSLPAIYLQSVTNISWLRLINVSCVRFCFVILTADHIYMLRLFCLPHLTSSKLSLHLLFPDLCFVQHPSSTITCWNSYSLKSRIAALTTAASKEQTQLRLSLSWHHPETLVHCYPFSYWESSVPTPISLQLSPV